MGEAWHVAAVLLLVRQQCSASDGWTAIPLAASHCVPSGCIDAASFICAGGCSFLLLPRRCCAAQGTADAVRQYMWLFDEACRDGVEDFLILSGGWKG